MSDMNSHGRRTFLKSTAALLAAGAWEWPAAAVRAEDAPSVHGMLIVGEQTAFLSHLPIFGPPHDFQVVLQATFAKAGGQPEADYFADRKQTGTKVYTLEPERFVLTRLAAKPPLRSFKASLYRGHFERFPTPRAKDAARIAQNVDVTVTGVVHFRRFDPAKKKATPLEYLLFGKGTELFAAHFITGPPDFDQVISVTANHAFTDAELRKGVRIIVPDTANAPSNRMRERQPVSCRIAGAAGAAPRALQLQTGVELYFEEDELAG